MNNSNTMLNLFFYNKEVDFVAIKKIKKSMFKYLMILHQKQRLLEKLIHY